MQWWCRIIPCVNSLAALVCNQHWNPAYNCSNMSQNSLRRISSTWHIRTHMLEILLHWNQWFGFLSELHLWPHHTFQHRRISSTYVLEHKSSQEDFQRWKSSWRSSDRRISSAGNPHEAVLKCWKSCCVLTCCKSCKLGSSVDIRGLLIAKLRQKAAICRLFLTIDCFSSNITIQALLDRISHMTEQKFNDHATSRKSDSLQSPGRLYELLPSTATNIRLLHEQHKIIDLDSLECSTEANTPSTNTSIRLQQHTA